MEIKIIKGTMRYKTVEVREPLVEDVIEAQKYENDTESAVALIAQICTFDGKNLTMEDVQKLPLSDFLDLQNALQEAGLLGLQEGLSHLSGSEGSTTEA